MTFKIIFFISLFLLLAVLSFHGCIGSSLVAASRGYSLVAVRGLLIAAASLVAEHRLWGTRASAAEAPGLCSCSSQALEHRLNSCGA